MPAIPNEAGPSRVKPSVQVNTEPNEDVDDPRASVAQTAGTVGGPAQAEEGDEDEERMDFKAIESIAR